MEEIKLSENMNNSGSTYSQSTYNEYYKTGKKDLFEEVIDSLMLNKYSNDDSFTEKVRSATPDKKRMLILTRLDNDKNLWTKITDLIWKSNNRMDYIKEVVLMLREFVKVGEVEKKKYGEVMTPLDLVKDMLNTLPEDVWSNPNLKWLDPANGTGPFPIMVIYKLMSGLKDWEPDQEKRYKHIIENMIYTCELQDRNVFLWLCAVDPKDEYTTNTYWGSFLEEGFDKHMKEVWNVEKFDIVIGNPPYNQMIDLNFLEKSYHICEQILFVHPSTWLIDEKNKQKKFIKTKELIKNDLKSITLFNGNKIFNIALFVPCLITYIDRNKKSIGIECYDSINGVNLIYDDISQINKYSNKDIYINLKNKINKSDSNLWYQYKNNNCVKDYMISFTGIRGNVNLKNSESMIQKDFYTIVSNARIPQSSNVMVNESFIKFYFNTELECSNFLNYLKTYFVRFCLSIYKNNQNLHRGELEIIPWLDFTQEWTDEKLKKHFNITDKEWEFIESVIPDYY